MSSRDSVEKKRDKKRREKKKSSQGAIHVSCEHRALSPAPNGGSPGHTKTNSSSHPTFSSTIPSVSHTTIVCSAPPQPHQLLTTSSTSTSIISPRKNRPLTSSTITQSSILTNPENLSTSDSGIDIYIPGELLGKGAFGSVYKAMRCDTGAFVAMKQIELEGIEPEQKQTVLKELNLLSSLSHPNIIKLYESFQTTNQISLVLEYIENGSLERVIKKYGPLKEGLLCRFMCQVLNGLTYLHQQEVIHLDIKAGNILVTKDGTVKVTDFGIAETFSSTLHTDRNTPGTMLGSPYWMAPEVIELEPATWGADIWSTGCTIIELVTGDPPFFHLGKLQAVFAMVSEEHPPIPKVSDSLSDLLLSTFKRKADERPTAKRLLEHRFFKDVPSSLLSSLPSSPSLSVTLLPPSSSFSSGGTFGKKVGGEGVASFQASLSSQQGKEGKSNEGKEKGTEAKTVEKNRLHLTLIGHDILRPGEDISDVDTNKLKKLLHTRVADLAKLQDKDKAFGNALSTAKERLVKAESKQVEVHNDVSSLQDEVFLLCSVLAKCTGMDPSRILKQVTGEGGPVDKTAPARNSSGVSRRVSSHSSHSSRNVSHSRSASDATPLALSKPGPDTKAALLEPSESDKERYKWMMSGRKKTGEPQHQQSQSVANGTFYAVPPLSPRRSIVNARPVGNGTVGARGGGERGGGERTSGEKREHTSPCLRPASAVMVVPPLSSPRSNSPNQSQKKKDRIETVLDLWAGPKK